MTIVNCGSGYPLFAPSVFSYLCSVPLMDIIVSNDEVPDHEIKELINQVKHGLLCDVL